MVCDEQQRVGKYGKQESRKAGSMNSLFSRKTLSHQLPLVRVALSVWKDRGGSTTSVTSDGRAEASGNWCY